MTDDMPSRDDPFNTPSFPKKSDYFIFLLDWL